ncbi:MAG: protein-(glutamine-N5) methyltransferase, release factor-specific [Desulfobulbus propionicus]|nr:MAG: protein-(glutamine-N5) methyltransferase, release factor-specific [Desulfobulbus propionicus]
MHLAEFLTKAGRRLHHAGIAGARLEAELLLQHVLNCSRSTLYSNPHQALSPSQSEAFTLLVEKRCRRIPLQHLIGHWEFWSLDFLVSPDALIPRPETEFLLECVLARVDGEHTSLVLDLGTGSGVIAIILALEMSAAVLATDLSLAALSVAEQNLIRHACADQVTLVASDLFGAVSPDRQFDCIVTNPPYVGLTEKETLEPEVRDHEPHLALFAGQDGLDCITAVLCEAPLYLRSGGNLFIEIGATQGRQVLGLAEEAGRYSAFSVLKDWSGRDRVFHGMVRA